MQLELPKVPQVTWGQERGSSRHVAGCKATNLRLQVIGFVGVRRIHKSALAKH